MFIGVYILILLLCCTVVNVDKFLEINAEGSTFLNLKVKPWSICGDLSTFFQHPMLYFMYRNESIFALPVRGSKFYPIRYRM